MTFAVQEGAIKMNPVREIARLSERRAKNKQKVARSLTADELMSFLEALDSDEEAIRQDLPDLVRLFVGSGERRGEALGADWPDFDAGAGELNVTGNVIQARGKGTVRNQGKSETSIRSIALPAWCVQMLAERRAALMNATRKVRSSRTVVAATRTPRT